MRRSRVPLLLLACPAREVDSLRLPPEGILEVDVPFAEVRKVILGALCAGSAVDVGRPVFYVAVGMSPCYGGGFTVGTLPKRCRHDGLA